MIAIRRLLYPDLEIERLIDIPMTLLKEKNIQGLIFDLDNTIIGWDSNEMQQEIISWLSNLKDNGFKIYIVSNSMKKRVKNIAESLSIPYIARAGKPMNYGFLKALKNLNLDSKSVAVVGDQIFTDVLGGNRIGAFTILVKPLSKKEFFTTQLTRKFERLLLDRKI